MRPTVISRTLEILRSPNDVRLSTHLPPLSPANAPTPTPLPPCPAHLHHAARKASVPPPEAGGMPAAWPCTPPVIGPARLHHAARKASVPPPEAGGMPAAWPWTPPVTAFAARLSHPAAFPSSNAVPSGPPWPPGAVLSDQGPPPRSPGHPARPGRGGRVRSLPRNSTRVL